MVSFLGSIKFEGKQYIERKYFSIQPCIQFRRSHATRLNDRSFVTYT